MASKETIDKTWGGEGARAAFGHSKLSNSLWHQHAMIKCLFKSWLLLLNVPGKVVGDDLSAWIPAAHRAPRWSSRLLSSALPDPTLAIGGIYRVN